MADTVLSVIGLIFCAFVGFTITFCGSCSCCCARRGLAAEPWAKLRWRKAAAVALCGGTLLVFGFAGALWSATSPPLLSLPAATPTHRRNDPARSVYFGNGCFWHTQYDMYVAEADAFGAFGGRPDANVTSLAGYAGGAYMSLTGTACYHGVAGLDYSRMGHAEAVSVTLGLHGRNATAQLAALAKVYFEHGFATTPFGRQRLDPADRGAEYRNVIGLPGGMDNAEWYAAIRAANVFDMPLLRGRPSGDVQGEYVVYVYDSAAYPFFRGEESHQFHENSVIGRAVPYSYLVTLKAAQRALGRLDHDHGCLDPHGGGIVTTVLIVAFGGLLGAGAGLLAGVLGGRLRPELRRKLGVERESAASVNGLDAHEGGTAA